MTYSGKFPGLHGEVVTHDVYKMRQLPFVPDLVFDIGANIGIFSRFASELFPAARIIALEPHDENIADFKHYGIPENATLIEKALGSGPICHRPSGLNGAHEFYLSESTGYPLASLKELEELGWLPTDIESVTVQDLFDKYWDPSLKTIVKIDVEGAENSMYDHEPSMECLRGADYVVMEIHNHAHHGGLLTPLLDLQDRQLKSFELTHDLEYSHPIFHATKKSHA